MGYVTAPKEIVQKMVVAKQSEMSTVFSRCSATGLTECDPDAHIEN